jgi:hypothetical protein
VLIHEKPTCASCEGADEVRTDEEKYQVDQKLMPTETDEEIDDGSWLVRGCVLLAAAPEEKRVVETISPPSDALPTDYHYRLV